MKPQIYTGEGDLVEYLIQFNILAMLNKWDYATKSLFLASSLDGDARTLLTELDQEENIDFNALVDALERRFGSAHRAEVFRASLVTRSRNKDESMPKLAQEIKKLTRKAYPNATQELLNVLSLDHFIDAIDNEAIRLRLREVCPRDINEAENIGVRLEAHMIADKNRHKYVRELNNVGMTDEPEIMNDMEDLRNEMEELKRLYVSNQNNQGQLEGYHQGRRFYRNNDWYQAQSRYNNDRYHRSEREERMQQAGKPPPVHRQ